MTIRRLRVLVNGLPSTSNLHHLMRKRFEEADRQPTPIEDLPPDYWSTTDYLIAAVADNVEALAWMLADPKSRPQEPHRLPRPGTKSTKKKGTAAWFGGLGL
jgi:hypothetical protein